LGGRHLPVIAIEPEALQDAFGLRRVLKAAFTFVFMLQIAVASQNLLQIVAGIAHTVLELMHLVLDLLQATKGRQGRFVHSRAFREVNVLGQQPELKTARPNDISAVGSDLFGDQMKDCGLAGAVAADQPDVLAGIYLQAGAAQDILRPVRFMNV
jgi:hypothetical protein